MQHTQAEGGEPASLDGFVGSNYAELRRWALQITSFDEALSDDILHDVYLRLRRQKISRAAVEDPNGYLYVSLRNTFRSHLKSAGPMFGELSILDHLDPENRSLVFDPEPVHRAEDELTAIGNYLCARKRASIAASIAILRFFHGYSIDEISKVSNRSRNAIEARISKVRLELQDVIAGKDSPIPVGQIGGDKFFPPESHPDIFSEIRSRILRASAGRCISSALIKRLFRKDSGKPDREELAHIVGCEKCLDLINEKLRLPKLRERHPLDDFEAKLRIGSFSSG